METKKVSGLTTNDGKHTNPTWKWTENNAADCSFASLCVTAWCAVAGLHRIKFTHLVLVLLPQMSALRLK